MIRALKLFRVKDYKDNHLFYQNFWNKINANEKAIQLINKREIKNLFFLRNILDRFYYHLFEAKEIL